MRCLLLSCSDSKSAVPTPLPALERYSGPAFKVLRRYLRDHPHTLGTELLVGILSARYGLIWPTTQIPDYNLRMSQARARQLQPQVLPALRQWLSEYRQLDLMIVLGRTYQFAIEPLDGWLPYEVSSVAIAKGGSGKKLQQMAHWLDGTALPIPSHLPEMILPSNPKGSATLRGMTVEATPEQVAEYVESWIADGDEGYRRSNHWFALVGPHEVSPKWLVSQLSGVPVRQFAADEARRVLTQLGIPLVFR